MGGISAADRIQIIVGLLVFVGLVLVIYELRQNRVIANVEAVNLQYDAIRSHYDTLLGENPAEVLSKACTDSPSLTDAEQRIVNAYFNSIFVTVRRIEALATVDFGGSSEERVSWWTGTLTSILIYPDGKHWWKKTRDYYLLIYPEVVEHGDQLAASLTPAYTCKSWYQDWGASDA